MIFASFVSQNNTMSSLFWLHCLLTRYLNQYLMVQTVLFPWWSEYMYIYGINVHIIFAILDTKHKNSIWKERHWIYTKKKIIPDFKLCKKKINLKLALLILLQFSFDMNFCFQSVFHISASPIDVRKESWWNIGWYSELKWQQKITFFFSRFFFCLEK